MSASLLNGQWTTIFPELLRVLRPGGCIEVFNSAGDYENAGHWQRTFWTPKVYQFRTVMGMDVAYRDFSPLLEQAGFTTIQKADILLPLGPWAGKLGVIAADLYKRIFAELKVCFLSSGVIPSVEEAEEAFQGRIAEVASGQEALVWNVYTAKRPG
jgi:hypothetical protein